MGTKQYTSQKQQKSICLCLFKRTIIFCFVLDKTDLSSNISFLQKIDYPAGYQPQIFFEPARIGLKNWNMTMGFTSNSCRSFSPRLNLFSPECSPILVQFIPGHSINLGGFVRVETPAAFSNSCPPTPFSFPRISAIPIRKTDFSINSSWTR